MRVRVGDRSGSCPIVSWLYREAPSEEVTFELKLKRGKVMHNEIRRKGVPSGGHSMCKGPGVERSWTCLRNIKEDAEVPTGCT